MRPVLPVPYRERVRQVRGRRRDVIPALMLAIALLAWVAASFGGDPAAPTASAQHHRETAIETANSLLVVTSDRPRVSVAPLRLGKARAVSTSLSLPVDVEAPRWDRSGVSPASSLISIGPLGVGLTRRGPPPPLSS